LIEQRAFVVFSIWKLAKALPLREFENEQVAVSLIIYNGAFPKLNFMNFRHKKAQASCLGFSISVA